MPHFVEVDGQFKRVTASWVGVGGAWKRVLGRHVGVGDQWKLKFLAGRVQLQFVQVRGFDETPGVPEARITFQPDGRLTASYSNRSFTNDETLVPWHDPVGEGAGSAYEIRHVPLAGDPALLHGDPVGQWLPLSQARSWYIVGLLGAANVNRAQSYAFYAELRASGGGPLLARQQMGLTVNVYDPDHQSGGGGGGGGVNRPQPPQFQQ